MPAHHGISDLLKANMAVVLQHTPLANLTDWGYVFNSMKLTKKGREILANGRDEFNDTVTFSAANNILERMRAKREKRFDNFQEYRGFMDDHKPYGRESYDRWKQSSLSMADAIKQLKTSGDYDEKGHQSFKLEWEMYLKPGTAFEHIVQQFFAEGWHVLAIMRKNRNLQLKRLETKKPGKSTKILWTA
jgi:hypothetical protein